MCATLNPRGSSANHVFTGSNPVDVYPWQGDDADLDFAQKTSISGQFMSLWKLREMAQGTTLKGITNNAMRRIVARNQAFGDMDIAVGNLATLSGQISRRRDPIRRGLDVILDIDETGAPAGFRGHAFKIARYYVRNRMVTSPDPDLARKDDEELLRARGNVNAGRLPRPEVRIPRRRLACRLMRRCRQTGICGGVNMCAAR